MPSSSTVRFCAVVASLVAVHSHRLAAQQTVIVTVSATVSPTASLQTSPIEFGEIAAGQAATLPPTGGGSGKPGEIMVDANATEVTVVIPNEMVLTSGTAALTAHLACAAAERDGASPTLFDCVTGQTFRNAVGAQSRRVIYVGGSIAASETSDKPVGAYRGTVTVTATYSSS